MYALSMRQPWASLVVQGPKRAENRTFRCLYTGPVLIHASAKMTLNDWCQWVDFSADRQLENALTIPPNDLPKGGIIGVARITGCVSTQDALLEAQRPWWMGPFAWTLEDVTPTPFLPWKGMLGLFRVEPPAKWLAQCSPEASTLIQSAP